MHSVAHLLREQFGSLVLHTQGTESECYSYLIQCSHGNMTMTCPFFSCRSPEDNINLITIRKAFSYNHQKILAAHYRHQSIFVRWDISSLCTQLLKPPSVLNISLCPWQITEQLKVLRKQQTAFQSAFSHLSGFLRFEERDC